MPWPFGKAETVRPRGSRGRLESTAHGGDYIAQLPSLLCVQLAQARYVPLRLEMKNPKGLGAVVPNLMGDKELRIFKDDEISEDFNAPYSLAEDTLATLVGLELRGLLADGHCLSSGAMQPPA
jgi:hypothetical protein